MLTSTSDVGPTDPLDLAQDRRLTPALRHQLSEALLSEVGADADIIRMVPKGNQHALGQVEDLKDTGDTRMVLPDGPGEGADAAVAVLLYQSAVALGALPGGLVVHMVLVGSPLAGMHGPVAVDPFGDLSADEPPPTVLVDREVIVYHEYVGRSFRRLIHFRVPGEGGLMDVGFDKGPHTRKRLPTAVSRYNPEVDQDRLEIPLYRPYEKLIEITVRGKKCQIPENQLLLRAFQYLCPDTIPYGRYCWNEECQYCRVVIKKPGVEKVTQALSCKLMAEEGLEVQELADELIWGLRRLFATGEDGSQESGAGSQNSKGPDS